MFFSGTILRKLILKWEFKVQVLTKEVFPGEMIKGMGKQNKKGKKTSQAWFQVKFLP